MTTEDASGLEKECDSVSSNRLAHPEWFSEF
jgi:hypothetical protein